MVGRSLNPGYRGDLNLLSRRDYTPSPARYIRMRVGAIVGFATAQYHCRRRLSKEIHGERLPGMNRGRARAQPLKSPAPWQAASRDLHSDERLPTS
jgi:hypothetical protein